MDETNSHQNDDKIICLVDLHNTCLPFPFHREGLPYLYFALISFILMVSIIKRIVAREILNSPYPSSSIREWHLLIGRMSVMFYLLGGLLDNIRLFAGSFDKSWPSYIISASPNATLANERWVEHHHNYHTVGIGIQLFLKWYADIFTQFTPYLCIYAVTFLYYKAIVRSAVDGTINGTLPFARLVLSPRRWFLTCTAVVSATIIPCLVGFILGPIQGGPLKVIRVTEIWSLDYTTHSPTGFLSILVWQCTLIVFAVMWIWNCQDLSTQTICFLGATLLCCTTNILLSRDPRIAWLSQLIFVALQLWADAVHNPDDYGRLNDDTLSTLRRPLLLPSRLSQQQQQQQRRQQREEQQQNSSIERGDNNGEGSIEGQEADGNEEND